MCNSTFLLTTFTLLLCTTFVHGGQGDALFLTPLIASGNISMARNLSLVLTLPHSSSDIPSRPSYSGLITVNETNNSNLFFWFFPATENCTDVDKTPLVLWLEGGPGVSSFLSLFTQNGPYSLKSHTDGTFDLQPRLEDWTVNRSMIYVESTVDVGYSFTPKSAGLPKTSEEAAESLVEFLRQFFLLFPEYTSNPFHLIGHSYGGHFAPAVGAVLHQRNEEKVEPQINFRGVLLIAPWTNPLLQVDSRADFMYHTALIDERARDNLVMEQEFIKELITEKKYNDAEFIWRCTALYPGSLLNNASGFTAPYNLLKDQNDSDSSSFANYAELTEFRQAVHVGNLTYTKASEVIPNSMIDDLMSSKSHHVERLLRAQKYKIIVATGQMDLMVAHKGVEKMLNHLVWSGQNEWKLSNRTVWKGADGHVVGYKKEVSNLTLYIIRNAGHMLIEDQPAWTLEFVNEILSC